MGDPPATAAGSCLTDVLSEARLEAALGTASAAGVSVADSLLVSAVRSEALKPGGGFKEGSAKGLSLALVASREDFLAAGVWLSAGLKAGALGRSSDFAASSASSRMPLHIMFASHSTCGLGPQ